jgi:hypothetical protein
MRRSHRYRIQVTAAVVALACAAVTPALAGGGNFGDDDDASAETGPSYFGFVRDTSGATIRDAKVTVSVKNRGDIITRTDALGTYKIPGFGTDVNPDDVQVSCDKPGYKQARTVRRSLPSKDDPKIPIETECTLQRL